jgi:hypothetical protein
MLKKYARKISNTIGSVNYLVKKSNDFDHPGNRQDDLYRAKKCRSRRSSSTTTNTDSETDFAFGGCDPSPIEEKRFILDPAILALPAAQRIISEAMDELRQTLYFYVYVC